MFISSQSGVLHHSTISKIKNKSRYSNTHDAEELIKNLIKEFNKFFDKVFD